jgi:glycosyltransferase involved in cell wall biosynthesis
VRILMLLDKEFPPDIRVEKEARTLIKAGHELSLLSLGISGKPRGEIIEGIKVIRTELPLPKTVLGRVWDEFRFTFNFIDPFWREALVRAVKREKPQVLHIHDLAMVKTGLSVARAFNIPLVADLHENFPEALRVWRTGWKGKVINLISPPWRWKRLEKYCVHRADRVIAVMDEAKEHYVTDCRMSPEEITVVMNTTDLDYFYSLPLKKEIIDKYEPFFTILYIGAVAVHKGMGTAISAMPLILEEIPNALLVLVGKGEEALFKKMASNKHLERAVQFVSWQDFTLMPSYITASDVCIMPYLASAHVDTSSPHKLFQYMAMAKPMVVSSARPLARVAKETGSGLVYRAGDVEGFAKAIIEIYKDRDLSVRLGAAGQKAAKEKYNWQNDGQKLLQLYEGLAGVK